MPTIKTVGVIILRKYFLLISIILALGLLSLTSVSAAAGIDSVIEGAGELGSFGADVLEDFVLDSEDAEGSGKARLKAIIKGKSLDWLKGKVTGGGDISAGMDAILKQIYKEVNAGKRPGGVCDPAALNQARTIAFDAKNLRLLRGSANVVFDLLTSAIPGASGLAEKLVESIGTAAYKKIRSEIQTKIKEAWSKQKPEAFKYSRQSGPCKLSMTVIWNKVKGSYLYIITGACFCQNVPLWPPYRPEPVPLKSLTLIGGGNITPYMIGGAPGSMNIGFRIRPKRKKMLADCNCSLEESRIEEPPTGGGWMAPCSSTSYPEVSAYRTENSGRKRIQTGVKCEVCRPLLNAVNEFVPKFNNIAQEMDGIAKRINGEPRKTPARDADEAAWDALNEQLTEIEAAQNKAHEAFVQCEEEECKDGTDPFVLSTTSGKEMVSSTCKECATEVEAANALIEGYNKIVAEMNSIASITQKIEVKHGTKTGNTYYANWQNLNAQLGPLEGPIDTAIKALKICIANKCSTGNWKPHVKPFPPRTGICYPCQSEANAYNDAVKELNKVIDDLNALMAEAAGIEKEHGDGPELKDYLQNSNFHNLVVGERELFNKLEGLDRALDACIELKCRESSGFMPPEESYLAGPPDLDFLMIAPCNRPNNELMGYNPNGTPYYNTTDVNHDFQWYGGGNQHYPNGANIVAFEPDHGAGAQYFNNMRNQKGKINCKKLTINIAIFVDGVFVRKIQEGQDKPQITPNDTYYKFEAKASRKLARGLMKGLGVLQGLRGGGISLGGGGGSKKGTADDQWGLWKVGFTPFDSPSSAWKIETGEGKPVVVAVIDSGLDITHPDLSLDNLWRNEGEIPGNFIDDDGNGYIDDTFGWNFIDWNNVPFDNNGHGTFVAGIIAAKSNNGIGIAGINQGVRIMPLKVTNYMGETNNFDIYRAIVYAVDNGARIINISIGGSRLSKLEQVAVDYAYDNGILVVVAAGNQGKELVDYGPSGLQKVFSVAALDVSGKRRQSSNYGPTVAITAPGEEIISLRARETDFLRRLGGGSGILGEDGLYYKSTGSSFATPFVTGVASLMKAKDSDITNTELEGILMGSALDIEEPGWDIRSGAGLLNARGALSTQKEQVLTARITRIEKVKEGKKIVSYKIYGAASGGLFKDYSLAVGKGKKPKKWSNVSSPSTEAKDYDLLGTVDSKTMKGFGTWNVRLTVNGSDGNFKEVYLPFPKR